MMETGGGEGIEVVTNEPYERETDKGQYYHEVIHLGQKVPAILRALAPKGSMEIHAQTWNYYPTIHEIYSNPEYMKDDFFIDKKSIIVENDKAGLENVFELGPEKLPKRRVITIDIVNDPLSPEDYSEETDPTKVHLEKINRGPMSADWMETERTFLTVYIFVEIKFKWWGLQTRVQNGIQEASTRIYRKFYRTLLCTLDQWHGMTIEEIRHLEEDTKNHLKKERREGKLKGMIQLF